MHLRPYKSCDAEKIVSWIKDERSFRLWSSDRFGDFPLTADALNSYYSEYRDNDRHLEFTAYDDNGVCGHMIMRFTDVERKTVRFGFVIVDSERRRHGLGKSMLAMAENYAFDFLGAEKITLGVFANNPAALHCYLAAGFSMIGTEDGYYSFHGEEWKCIEMELIHKE